MSETFLYPDWHAPLGIKTCITTRKGGYSLPPYDGFNLGLHVGDDAHHVMANRRMLNQVLPAKPIWLNQVHGVQVFDADQAFEDAIPTADAAVTSKAGRVLAIMTADCLPILLCDRNAKVIGAAHAGWRGLCSGVIENTVALMKAKLAFLEETSISAFLGPAIGPTVFEVGPEVRAAFIDQHPEAEHAFKPSVHLGKYLADLYLLAKQRLNSLGITEISGGLDCTYLDKKFYSYRRDHQTGRMASFIWIDPSL